MVVAVLANRLFPSSRGITRRIPHVVGTNGAGEDAFTVLDSTGKRPRRKRFRAVAALTSLASDLDVLSDWIFYSQAVKWDREYREQYASNKVAVDDPSAKHYLIPPQLLTLLLLTSVCGTVLWFILATDGRIVTPFLRRIDIEKLSMGQVLLACVLLEDIPQVVLTFLIEDYFQSSSISSFALCNLTTSLYDTLIKLAEAYDERHDVVETGAWCKASFMAHKDAVTSILALPPQLDQDEDDIATNRYRPLNDTSTRKGRSARPILSSRKRLETEQSMWTLSLRSRPIPRFRLLTTSVDKSIRLWDIGQSDSTSSTDYVRKIKGHTKPVTCIAFLGHSYEVRVVSSHQSDVMAKEEENDSKEMDFQTFFITGSTDGVIKLWNLIGTCIRSFFHGEKQHVGVHTLAKMHRRQTFIAGYGDGSLRLWDAPRGLCIGVYRGHKEGGISLCSLQDECAFATASDRENIIRIWSSDAAMDHFYTSSANIVGTSNSHSLSLFVQSQSLSEWSPFEETVCQRTLVGHVCPILSLACVKAGQSVVSGSLDGTARIWSVAQDRPTSCLRILSGNDMPVRSVLVLDPSSILTSSGRTIRLFDGGTGNFLREFRGHSDMITGLAASHEEAYFLSCSTDRTVKVWVVSSISDEDTNTETLDDILDIDDRVCMCNEVD